MSQLKHGKHIGIVKLIKQTEPNNIKLVQWLMRFQGHHRDAAGFEVIFHIHTRGKNPFRNYLTVAIKNMIKDLKTKMRSADFIEVRKSKRNTKVDLAMVFFNRVYFRPQIPAGVLYERQDVLNDFHAHDIWFSRIIFVIGKQHQ